MLSKRILQMTADGIRSGTPRTSLAVADLTGRVLLVSGNAPGGKVAEELARFACGSSAGYRSEGKFFSRISDLDEPVFVIAAYGSDRAVETGDLFRHMIGVLFEKDRECSDRDDFLRRLLTGRILPSDAAGCAGELGIRTDRDRVVYAIRIPDGRGLVYEDRLCGRLKLELSDEVVPFGDGTVAVIHDISRSPLVESRKRQRLEERLGRLAAGEPAGRNRIGCGCAVHTIWELAASFGEAQEAIDTAVRFGRGERIHRSDDLLVEELISYLPAPVCRKFLEKTTGLTFFNELNPEMLRTAEIYLDNAMNASETSRQLYFHRNTLRYRLSHIQIASGLDIRKFRDASLFKLGSMIHRYMKTDN